MWDITAVRKLIAEEKRPLAFMLQGETAWKEAKDYGLAVSAPAAVPNAPLAAGTTYRVELDATVGATPLHLSWAFTTAP